MPEASKRPAGRKNLRNAPAAPRRNTRAVKTGAQSDGRNLPGFTETQADVQDAISHLTWLLPSDGPLVEVFIRELHAYRHATDVLARMTDASYIRRLNAARLCTRKAKVLGEIADRLGLSPVSRFRLGLVVAKTEAAVRVTPVRNEERARQVAELLAASGGVPPPFIEGTAEKES